MDYERDYDFTISVREYASKDGKRSFYSASQRGDRLADGTGIKLDPTTWYWVKPSKACGVLIPQEAGVYVVKFHGTAWLDRREGYETTVRLNGTGFEFKKLDLSQKPIAVSSED